MDILIFIHSFKTCVFKTVSLKGPNNQPLCYCVNSPKLYCQYIYLNQKNSLYVPGWQQIRVCKDYSFDLNSVIPEVFYNNEIRYTHISINWLCLLHFPTELQYNLNYVYIYIYICRLNYKNTAIHLRDTAIYPGTFFCVHSVEQNYLSTPIAKIVSSYVGSSMFCTFLSF